MNSKSNLAKLGRKKSHRTSLVRNQLASIILYEHMKTTKAKAKAILSEFDALVNRAKSTSEQIARRFLEGTLNDTNAVNKVLEVLLKRFENEQGGYIKMFNLGRRKGDNAEVVMLMLKGYVYKEIGKTAKKSAKKDDETAKTTNTDFKPVAEKNVNVKSQVSAGASQGKAKSRSGI